MASAEPNDKRNSNDSVKQNSQLKKWYINEARKLQNDILCANIQLEATRNQCGTMINEVKKRQAELEMELIMLKYDDDKIAGASVSSDYANQRECLVDRLREIRMEIDCLSSQVNKI